MTFAPLNLVSFSPGLVRGLRWVLASLLLLATACDSPTTPGGQAPVASVTVNVASAQLAIGGSLALVATPRDAQGRPVAGYAVAWESESPSIATVGSTGLVTAVTVGETRLKVTVAGKFAFVNIAVSPIPVSWVSITPELSTVEMGESVALEAHAFDAEGRELGGRVATWSIVNPAVLSIDASGRATGIQPGVTAVWAVIEGRRGVAQVEIVATAVARLELSRSQLDLETGEAAQLTARYFDARGVELGPRPTTWVAQNEAAATVSGTGVVSARGLGTSLVTATSEGLTAAASVSVGTAPLADLIYDRAVTGGGAEVMTLQLAPGAAPVRVNAGSVSHDPSPSPDGLRLVFAVAQIDPLTGGQQNDLFIVNRNGLNMRWFTRTDGVEQDPAWSPDGSRILFSGYDPVSNSLDIWVVNADGTGLTNLTAAMGLWSDEIHPAWSADGSRIAFGARGVLGTARLWTMLADGTGLTALTPDALSVSHPTWSPDGTRIAFSVSGADANISIVPADGGVVTALALPGAQYQPAWSPDGRHIAFAGATGNGPTELYTMRSDGSDVRLRTTQPGWGGGRNPSWIRRVP